MSSSCPGPLAFRLGSTPELLCPPWMLGMSPCETTLLISGLAKNMETFGFSFQSSDGVKYGLRLEANGSKQVADRWSIVGYAFFVTSIVVVHEPRDWAELQSLTKTFGLQLEESAATQKIYRLANSRRHCVSHAKDGFGAGSFVFVRGRVWGPPLNMLSLFALGVAKKSPLLGIDLILSHRVMITGPVEIDDIASALIEHGLAPRQRVLTQRRKLHVTVTGKIGRFLDHFSARCRHASKQRRSHEQGS